MEQPFRPSDVHKALHALQQDLMHGGQIPSALRAVASASSATPRIGVIGLRGDGDEVVTGTDRLAQLLDLPSKVGQLRGCGI